uniref:Nuclear pore complex protein Nup85 n=1 Tax=Corethron hystrix TaxID=216773 RepID=A0A6U5KLI7_9STRA|mmetsp:Transcript_39646/g.92759  ORF Transcript_39646/g.92759 Transcript_39646/m.92759 type:complete len:589 (+) Transcript_39646:1234-3000(+)
MSDRTFFFVTGTTFVHMVVFQLCISTSDNQGFYDLRGILLFAPIPGGRSIEEEDAPLPAASENIGDMDKDLFLGIPFAAWRMWDGHGGGASSAMSHWRTWCSYLENSSKMGSDTFLGKLIRKVPMLRWAVIDVLKGKVQWTEHVSWAEALLVELLYGDPRTLQSSLVEKARTAMHIAGGKSEVNEVHMKFLKILEGNAAEAVNTIHSLGGSGDSPIAATVCALLCDLLTRSGKIDFKISEGDNYCYIRSDFFHSAAMSCEAAFVGYNGHAGVLTAAKLLKLDESRNAIAAIHDLFCRHYPQKDEETKELMQFCKYDPDLQDAGCTLACARANSYLSESKQGDFVFWMLRGIEAIDSSSSLTKFNAITCLSSHCGNIAQNILYNLASKGFKEITTELEDGKMVVKAIEKDAVLNNPDMGSVSRAFSLLSNVVDLGVSIQSENYINSCDIIISCLLSRTEYNGVNLPLAPVMLYCPLIKIAAVLISQIKSSFDVSGIQTLMSSLSIIEQNLCLVDETLQKIGILRSNWNRSLNGASLTFTIEGLRREFGKGLALAYLKKNKLCNLDERILIDGLDDSAHYVNEVLYCSFI